MLDTTHAKTNGQAGDGEAHTIHFQGLESDEIRSAAARWVVDAWTETWLSPRFADWNLNEALDRVRCPVLAIHGELDEYGSAEHPRRIAAGRGKMELLTGIGHVPQREAGPRVAELIRAFVERSIR